MDRLPVDEPELVLLGSGVSLGPVDAPRVQAMLDRMAVCGATSVERPPQGLAGELRLVAEGDTTGRCG